MLAYIKGKILAQGLNFVVLKTSSGVGYLIYVPPRLIKGEKMALFVYHYQTEKTDSLYGFEKFEERELFERLLKINGLGPKGALALLSLYHPKEIFAILEKNEVEKLEAVPGIGKKTARKIMVDLAGVFIVKDQKGKEQLVVEALQSLGYSAAEARASLDFLTGKETNLQEKITKILKEKGKNG